MAMNICEEIKKRKLITIMRGVKGEQYLPLTEALWRGGVGLAEVTVNQSGDVRDTCDAISRMREAFDGRVEIGAGTVMTVAQLDEVLRAGATFIISPNSSRAVIEATKERGAVSIPGAFTPSEIASAYEWGADFVKLFPADALGIPYIKSITAPISHIPLLAVGGVTDANLGELFAAGIRGVGVGTNIISKKLLAEGDYDGIEALARRFVTAIENA